MYCQSLFTFPFIIDRILLLLANLISFAEHNWQGYLIVSALQSCVRVSHTPRRQNLNSNDGSRGWIVDLPSFLSEKQWLNFQQSVVPSSFETFSCSDCVLSGLKWKENLNISCFDRRPRPYWIHLSALELRRKLWHDANMMARDYIVISHGVFETAPATQCISRLNYI